MVLAAESRATNHEKSLNIYLHSTLVTADGLDVLFPGAKTIYAPSGSLWVVVEYLLGVSRRFRGAVKADGSIGNYTTGIINLNCCEFVAQRTDRYALPGLRDTVMSRVNEGNTIPIRDYDTGGNPVVGYWSILSVTENPVSDGLGQGDNGIAVWNVSAFGDYIEVI